MAGKFFAVIAGIGGGTGRSVALKFSAAYPVVLLSRNASSYEGIVDEIKKNGGQAFGIETDVIDGNSVKAAFATIKKELGDAKLAAAIYNVGGGMVRKPFLQLTAKEYTSGFESNALGLYNFAQEALPLLLDSVATSVHPPTLLLTGATASLRGGPQLASFASGKFALRATGQSLAREFGPQGVHVAHAIIDGGITGPRAAGRVMNNGAPDGVISADAIAESYWHLHIQHRSALTQELDIRPYVEKF